MLEKTDSTSGEKGVICLFCLKRKKSARLPSETLLRESQKFFSMFLIGRNESQWSVIENKTVNYLETMIDEC